MTREWDDGEARRKRRPYDRRDRPRPSSDVLRREEELRRELRELRDDRRSLGRRGRSRSPLAASGRRRSPSPGSRHGWSPPSRSSRPASPRHQAPLPAATPRKYVPPHTATPSGPSAPASSASAAPGAGHLRGCQGLAKKKCRRGQLRGAAAATPALAPGGTIADGPVSGLPRPLCFNCGVAGHSQVNCVNPQCCYICKDLNHPALLCLDRLVTSELMMYGHGIEGLGFFHLEVLDVPPPSPSLQAIFMVVDEVASPEMIEAELNHLYRCQWDWAVTPTVGHISSVVFPDAISYGYATHSGQITLALNQLVVNISEPILDPKTVAILDTAWILVAGLPDIARSEAVIRQMSRILGKVVVVDELSLRKEEVVRVKVKCLDSSKLRATIRVFFNDQGFDLRIAPEPPNHVGRPRFSDDGPPGPTREPVVTTTTATTLALAAREMRRRARRTCAPALRLRHLLPRPREAAAARPRSSLAPLIRFSQSSPRTWRPCHPTEATLPASAWWCSRRPLLAPPPTSSLLSLGWGSLPSLPRIPLVLPRPSPRRPPLLVRWPPRRSCPRARACSCRPLRWTTHRRPRPLRPRRCPWWTRPPSSPPRRRLLHRLRPVSSASPGWWLTPRRCSSPLRWLRLRLPPPVASQPPPPRSAACSRRGRGRSSSSPVTASRRSSQLDAARPVGTPALPIHARAELQAAARNLEPGTPVVSSSAATCSFSALESVPLGHLAKVAADSAIIFRGEVAPTLVQIAAIQARELLDGKLAEAHASLLSPPVPSAHVVAAAPATRRRTGALPPLDAAEPRGRTRSSTSSLRAQSASRVLGSSSPPMAP
ncbi:uncharacterized protein [Triticum aestivum]|uniref:uncharacterized protein n=1 Tax=Triticum aestivum TaxID=4565 RepID=UPI001D01F0A8|nr:uncharacterized protein LOC123111576 [Triticum aestivum]